MRYFLSGALKATEAKFDHDTGEEIYEKSDEKILTHKEMQNLSMEKQLAREARR